MLHYCIVLIVQMAANIANCCFSQCTGKQFFPASCPSQIYKLKLSRMQNDLEVFIAYLDKLNNLSVRKHNFIVEVLECYSHAIV
jgi:hypothetical protein